MWVYSNTMLLKRQCAANNLEILLMQILIQWILDEHWDSAFPTSSSGSSAPDSILLFE